MAVAAPIEGPDLDPWQDTRPLSSDVLPNEINSSTDDYHADDMAILLNGGHLSINGNSKAEPRHTISYGGDTNVSDTGHADQENEAHESAGGEDEDESGEDDDDSEGEEEEEEEEEEDEGDYEDEEEDEPTLKYERMNGAVNDLFKKDSASALAVSNKLLVNLSL